VKCSCEFPIIDGIPVIVAEIRSYIAENILQITARDDLDGVTESIIGDCCGPSSDFDMIRHHLSTYTWSHYGDLDPDEAETDTPPGSIVKILKKGLSLIEKKPCGNLIDAGYSVGRATFELAAQGDNLVLGIDTNFSMLRVAYGILRNGVVNYPRKRVGVVYDYRKFPVKFANMGNVDFWVCDAAALPFSDGTFDAVSCLNVLDSIYSPFNVLSSISKVLKCDGYAIISTPYDWTPTVTRFEEWFGGHSQRGKDKGAGERVLRAMVSSKSDNGAIEGFCIVAEEPELVWYVRVHERNSAIYKTHLLVLKAI